jgi:hypothetical protein
MDSELKQYLDEWSERNAAELRQMREETAAQFREVREENAAAHEETRRVLRGEISEAVSTLRGETAAEFAKVREESAVAHAETRRHFDVTADSLRSHFTLLAETVQAVDQKIDREVADIRQEMRRGFTETQAMIKFARAPRTRRAKRH